MIKCFIYSQKRFLPDMWNLLSIYKNVQGSNFFLPNMSFSSCILCKWIIRYQKHLLGSVSIQKLFKNILTKYKGKHLCWRLYRLQGRSFHCVKIVRNRNYSSPHFPAFGLNTKRYPVSLHIHFECEKMQARITPNKNTFYAVFMDKKIGYLVILRNFLERLFM